MRRAFVAPILLVLTALAIGPPPVSADSEVAVLPQASRPAMQIRVARTIQGFSGPEVTTQTYQLVRKSPTALTIQRVDPHSVPTTYVLHVGPDGTVALADAAAAVAEPALGDVVYALDAAIVAMREATGSPHDSWNAYVPISGAKGAPTAGITFVPANVAGAEMDFYGTGQAVPGNPAAGASPAPERRRGGGRGGFGGGGFGGGGRGRYGARGGDQSGERAEAAAVATSVQIDGHLSDKRVTRIAITETRTVTVANLPFTNVSSWSIAVR
ncbi:MAG TPA: hypothetical protein VFB22_02760 [Candidatus Baltobacteraceae bacterium]|nr:hypothetical protein [Candidatus Baltobacteraceae bacterium]